MGHNVRSFVPLATALLTAASLALAPAGASAAAGDISLFAGNGTDSSSGDGGSATSASFRTPVGIATAPNGDVYIADSTANRVRRVSAGGTISTFAGTGTAGLSGDGGAATS